MTAFEVRVMFRNMVRSWFDSSSSGYNDFIRALLLGDVEAMNLYMNQVTQQMFSYFDTGSGAQGEERRTGSDAPERHLPYKDYDNRGEPDPSSALWKIPALAPIRLFQTVSLPALPPSEKHRHGSKITSFPSAFRIMVTFSPS